MGGPGQPVAVRTDFGWTLTGSISTLMPCTTRKVMFVRRPPSEDERLSETAQERRTEEDTAANTDKQTAPNTTQRTAADVTERTQEAGASSEGAHAFMVKPKLLNDKQRLVEGRRAEPMAEFKGRHRKKDSRGYRDCRQPHHTQRRTAISSTDRSGDTRLGPRLRYPELFSGTAVLLLAVLILLLVCFATATFLPLELLPARRRTDRFEQRQGYRGGVTASRPTSGILITFPNLSWRSEEEAAVSRHQDTAVSARFLCPAIGRGVGAFPYLGCDQSASVSLASEALKYSVHMPVISGLASEELISGSDWCLSSPSFP